jgi:hypothetical protein
MNPTATNVGYIWLIPIAECWSDMVLKPKPFGLLTTSVAIACG